MSVHGIVPVQLLETAKSRLAPVLTPEQRKNLVIDLFDNVLAALRNSGEIDQIVVVSPDPDMLKRADRSGAIIVHQSGRGLNAAIRLGRDHALDRGADAILIMLADLPNVTPSEIERLLDLSADVSVTLAPDRHGHGTNAMVLRPPLALEPSFGVDSFHKHSAEIERLGLSARVFESPGTSFDIDVIDDLNDLWRREIRGTSITSTNHPSSFSTVDENLPSRHVN